MRSALVAVSLAALVLSSTGCLVVDGGHRGPPPRAVGPPPHAPAHGYRHKHHGHDLVFDSDLGVYVVVGLPDLWFFDGSYFRWYGERWEIGVDVGGPWRAARLESVPVKLRNKRHPHGGPPGQMKKEHGWR
jgi:hypothetical protein